MFIHPVLIDHRPPYLGGDSPSSSLLRVPLGDECLFASLLFAIKTISRVDPIVLAEFETDAAYVRGIRNVCPAVRLMESAGRLREHVCLIDPSEELLLIDTRFHPVGRHRAGLFAPLIESEPATARHLLAVDPAPEHTREYVDEDADGRVRRIQRYYRPVTWPFVTSVVCSLVPVAALRTVKGLPLSDLTQLRTQMAVHAIPSRDLLLPSSCIDLAAEGGILDAIDRLSADGNAPVKRRPLPRTGSASHAAIAPRARVAPTARLVGDVIAQDGAHVDEGAVVIGPAVIGAGARVGKHSLVAQCLVMPGAEVPPHVTRRRRVVLQRTTKPAEAECDRVQASRLGTSSPVATETIAGTYTLLKAFLEPILAAIALLTLSPLFAVTALAIKVTSSGPVLFGHLREGRHGRPFRCWKFRTMCVGADAAQRSLSSQQALDGPQFKLAVDPRVTKVGRVLRATNLDELPQLINVLLGHMSFVGPRPSPFRENQICIPWRQGRLSVRPGITGLWQVCRHDREHGDFHQWIEYDLLYVGHVSPIVDLKILLATVVTLGGMWPIPAARIIPEVVGGQAEDRRAKSRSPRRRRSRRPHTAADAIGVRAALSILLLAIPAAAAASRVTTVQEPATAGSANTSGWRGEVRLGQGWESNANFVLPNGPSDVVTTAHAELLRAWLTPRDHLLLQADAEAIRFQELREHNRRTYGLSLLGGRNLSRRLNAEYSVRAQSELTNRSVTASGDGPLVVGLFTARTRSADAGLTYRASRRTDVTANARYLRASFDNDALAGGWIGAAAAQVSRRYSAQGTWSFGFEGRRSEVANRSVSVGQLVGTFDRDLSESVGLRLRAGTSDNSEASTRSTAGALAGDSLERAITRRFTAIGGGTLRYQRTRTQLTLGYERSTGEVFGLQSPGMYNTDAVRLEIGRTVERDLRLGFAAAQGSSVEQTAGRRHRLRSSEDRLFLAYSPTSGPAMALVAFMRRQSDLVAVSNVGLRLEIAYGWSWLHAVRQAAAAK